MKNRLLWIAASGVMLTAFLLAAVPARAQTVDDKIKSLESELSQLKEQQISLKKEAVAAEAALPSFSYRPGNGLNIEAADKSWVVFSQVTDILVDHILHKVPKGSYERRLALREIEAKLPDVASKHFYDRYGAISNYVRNNQNYFSSLDLGMLRYEVTRLGLYLADVKSVISK